MIELPVIDVSTDAEPTSRVRFWRSVSHLQNDPEYHRITREELLPGASNGPSGTSRRHFIQIMGASMALAGLSACRRPVEKILPFASKPEELIPGVPSHYATSMPFRGTLRGLLVKSTDGRPTKIEGNPDHPESQGATGIFEQAALLSVYDPDRSQVVLRNGVASSWYDFYNFISDQSTDIRVAVISEPNSSMALSGLRQQLRSKFAALDWVEYESTGDDKFASASRQVYGRSLRPRYHFERAKVIVSLDADFLGATDINSVTNTREFSAGRQVDDDLEMSRLYVVESQFSITGGMADNRLRIRSSDIPAFTAALAGEFGITVSGGDAFTDHPYVREIAADLRSVGSEGIVLAGDNQGQEVHSLCITINDRLGALGQTVTYFEVTDESADRISGLTNLIASINAGQVDLLFIIGANPVYDAPSDLGFLEALSSVGESIHLGHYVDETAAVSTWHIPRSHFLESWGDGRSYDGTMSVIQPLIAPLYAEAHSELELLGLAATGTRTTGYEIVRQTWQAILSGDFETAWRRVLHDGFLPGSGYSAVSPRLQTSGLPAEVAVVEPSVELVLRRDNSVLDGSFANNVWLQELPDPTTKIVWDNVALMNPATAELLGLNMRLTNGQNLVDRVTIAVAGSSVELPVWIQPGLADNTVALSLGYDRKISSNRPERKTNLFDLDDYTDVYGHGAISTGVGENVAVLRSSDSMSVINGAEFTRSVGDYLVASTQDHGALPEEQDEVERRGIFRMATLEEYRANPHFVTESEPKPVRENWETYPTLWESNHPTGEDAFKDNDYYRNQWGMVIDLNTCTGCNACVIACQSENNIQVIGKEEVGYGREMHWLRLDRYYVSGDGSSHDDPHMVIQPMPCMHCENAPCEEVCPVAATVHSPDGTNQMIYNRCVGTRYCANNCPYKVRRFNYYNWVKTLPASIHMAQNPNVTVRSRGVMEKCSFCIQRIREVNKRANVEERAPLTGEVQTACQQTCPASAITFGDLNKADSEVSEKRKSTRRYELLAELNVKPRTSFLGRVLNPNPRLTPRA